MRLSSQFEELLIKTDEYCSSEYPTAPISIFSAFLLYANKRLNLFMLWPGYIFVNVSSFLLHVVNKNQRFNRLAPVYIRHHTSANISPMRTEDSSKVRLSP